MFQYNLKYVILEKDKKCKKMKKIILLCLCLITLCGCGRNKDELIMVTEAGFAPFEYYENNEIVGVDVEVAKEIANKMGKKLVIKDVAFDSIINEVKSGKADIGAAGISYTEERSKQVDFSNDYFTSKIIVIVKDSDNETDFNNLGTKKIAVQLGSTADTFVTNNYKNATITRQKKYLAAIEDLKNDKVDCVVMDELPAKQILSKNTNLKILNKILSSENYGMVVKKNNKELLDTVNEVIEDLKESGKIDQYVLNYTE